MKLQGKNIYLALLERKDCKKLWNDFEYDFEHPTEEFNIGHSDEKADDWFDEIQKLQGSRNVRLGILSEAFCVYAVCFLISFSKIFFPFSSIRTFLTLKMVSFLVVLQQNRFIRNYFYIFSSKITVLSCKK